MKGLIGFMLLIFSVAGWSQEFQGMDASQIQQMMGKMAEMQSCYEKVDQSRLDQLAAEAKSYEAEFRQLCGNGERAAAQAKAMKLGMQYSSKPEIVQLKQCVEIARSAMPAGSVPEIPDFANPETYERHHVCDQL